MNIHFIFAVSVDLIVAEIQCDSKCIVESLKRTKKS